MSAKLLDWEIDHVDSLFPDLNEKLLVGIATSNEVQLQAAKLYKRGRLDRFNDPRTWGETYRLKPEVIEQLADRRSAAEKLLAEALF